MNVLLCALDSPATLQGGVEWYVHHLAKALGEEGHDVRVLSRRGEDVSEALREVRYVWADLPRGAATHRYRLLHEPAFWRAVKRESRGADVVHGQNIDATGAAKGVPVVATAHTTPLDEWASSRLGGWREILYQRQVEAYRRVLWRRLVRRAEHLWTQGPHVAESLRELGARDVEILPNPVPPIARIPQEEARARLGLPDGKLVLYLGRLAAVKRAHLAVSAIESLPDARLVIAGEGPERARIEELARGARVGERVRLLGRVEDEAKALLLNAADALILPSEHEGQPLVLLEAMSLGVPVVATESAWVPPGLRGHGFWGSDYAALLEKALARGRGEPAPVARYRDTARRVAQVYEEVRRR